MGKRKKHSSRSISPEHLAKLQEGRKRANMRKNRLKALDSKDDIPSVMKSEMNEILLKARMHD